MTLEEKLTQKPNGLLNIYCTAGYPNLNDLPTIVNALHDAGVDMVEIGIPYSDPIADGETIQQSNKIALENGITIKKIFEQVKACTPEIPKIMMGYFNPVLQYGIERFCKQAKDSGVDALIIPDLPIEIYESRYRAIFEQHGLSNIFLISPHTTEERMRKIDELSDSFIYAVSSSSITGHGQGIASSETYLQGLKELALSRPVLVGFNISSDDDLAMVHQHANGGIIGSAFIRHLQDRKDIAQASQEFVSTITSKESAL